jgi:hypothetical protein
MRIKRNVTANKIIVGVMAAFATAATLPIGASIAAPLVVTQKAAELAQGQFDNTTMINGAVQLANDRRFVPRHNPHNLFGLFTSTQQTVNTPFSSVTVDYQEKTPATSTLTFEIRTLATDGIWSPWIEITTSMRGKPVALEKPATAWQYKITLYANEPGLSPSVSNVTVATDGGAQ